MPTLPPTAPPTSPRIVKCPKCRSILQEPPPGNPFYQCGNCSTTLQARHATPRDLEAATRRISVEQRRRNSSYSDSSGEIISDAVVDEYSLTGSLNDSPNYKQRQETVSEYVLGGVTKRQLQEQYPALDCRMVLSDSFLQSLRNQELEMKHRIFDVSAGAEYISPKAAQQQQHEEIVSSREQLWVSSADQQASNGLSGVQVQPKAEACILHMDVTSAGELKTRPSVGAQTYGTETNHLTSAESRTASGNDFISSEIHPQQLQASHVQHRNHPDFARDSVQLNALNHHHHHHHETIGDDAHALQPPMTVGNNHIPSVASSRKLRWKIRDSDSGEEATSSGADDDGSSQDDVTSTLSGKDITTSTEYVVEPNWRSVHNSSRSSVSEIQQLAGAGASSITAGQGQQQLFVRTSLEESDRPFDMYENAGAHVLDYEPSDTSSTTVEEVEIINGLGAGSGRSSGEIMEPDLPRAIIDNQGISGPVSKRNLPRSTTAYSKRGGLSDEGSSHGSPTDMASPDNHIDNNRMANAAARRHSWDDKVPSMGTVAPGHTLPLRESPLSVRHKTSSADYGSGQQAEYLPWVSSDPSSRAYTNARGRPLSTSTSFYDNYSRQSNPFAGRVMVGTQQPWVNRYVPHSQSVHQTWSPNSAHHRSYVPEPSSLHPLHSRLSASARGQMQTAYLPSKQGLYPPLPPPGALQQVLCQHCTLLLVVPENLPCNQKNTQKLRCGSCRKISIFSVPRAEGFSPVQVFNSSSKSLQNSGAGLLASSPDSQAEFTSTYKPVCDPLGAGEKQRSVRRYSVSDLAERKQQVQQDKAQSPLIKKHSLGNEDLKEIDEELLERALSERGQNLSTNANFAASQAQDAASTGSETESPSSPYPRHKSNFSPNVNAGYKLPAPEGITSDSDSESMLRPLSAADSPQLNHLNSRSPPPPLPNRSPQQDPTTSGRASSDGTNEATRGLNKTLNRIFIFRKSKQAGAALYRRKVVVNGVPISDNLVKKAEEQAGPIHPGTYWYDSQAGFWGVAGGQCLGIIPPFIEEFNYPMTRDCAAGRTGIFVNGRELHYSDKEKLCRRGLPDSPGMSYLIEIDGRVIEEATGSELRSLGRLAPSLEKSGRGAGMHVPSNISGRS
ncbi:unnamed protein product [Calypogeia fissa]